MSIKSNRLIFINHKPNFHYFSSSYDSDTAEPRCMACCISSSSSDFGSSDLASSPESLSEPNASFKASTLFSKVDYL